MRLTVYLEQGATSWGASAESNSIQGVVSAAGESREDALTQFRSALRFHLDCLGKDGKKVPKIDALVIRELVEA